MKHRCAFGCRRIILECSPCNCSELKKTPKTETLLLGSAQAHIFVSEMH